MVVASLSQSFPALRVSNFSGEPLTLHEILLPDLSVTLSKTYFFDCYDSQSNITGGMAFELEAGEPLKLRNIATDLAPGEYLTLNLSDQGDHLYFVGQDAVDQVSATLSEYTVDGAPSGSGAPVLIVGGSDASHFTRPVQLRASRIGGGMPQVTVKPPALPGFLEAAPGSVPVRRGAGVVWETPAAPPEGGPARISLTITPDQAPGSFEFTNPFLVSLLRTITTDAPCTLAVYNSAAERDADAERLENTPMLYPTLNMPVAQATTVDGHLRVAIFEPLNAPTLYVRATALTPITFTAEEA